MRLPTPAFLTSRVWLILICFFLQQHPGQIQTSTNWCSAQKCTKVTPYSIGRFNCALSPTSEAEMATAANTVDEQTGAELAKLLGALSQSAGGPSIADNRTIYMDVQAVCLQHLHAPA
jgi:hypothetical protein